MLFLLLLLLRFFRAGVIRCALFLYGGGFASCRGEGVVQLDGDFVYLSYAGGGLCGASFRNLFRRVDSCQDGAIGRGSELRAGTTVRGVQFGVGAISHFRGLLFVARYGLGFAACRVDHLHIMVHIEDSCDPFLGFSFGRRCLPVVTRGLSNRAFAYQLPHFFFLCGGDVTSYFLGEAVERSVVNVRAHCHGGGCSGRACASFPYFLFRG